MIISRFRDHVRDLELSWALAMVLAMVDAVMPARRPGVAEAWAKLLTLARAGDVPGTERYVSTLDPAARAVIAAELPGYVARTPGLGRQAGPLLLAGVGCLSDPSQVAAWLFRPELREHSAPGESARGGGGTREQHGIGGGNAARREGRGAESESAGRRGKAEHAEAECKEGGSGGSGPTESSVGSRRAEGCGSHRGSAEGERAKGGSAERGRAEGGSSGSEGVESRRLLRLLRSRPLEWRAEAARHIASRLRLPELRHWDVAAALVRETGIAPPEDRAFVVGWLRSLRARRSAWSGTPVDDPLLAAYAPRLLDIDGLPHAELWPLVGTVVRLVEDGLLDRANVIEALLGRLTRSAHHSGQFEQRPIRDEVAAPRAGCLTPAQLVGLHDRLNLTIDESAAHAADYVRLLPTGPVAVADMAVSQLWRLEEAGRLDERLFGQALTALTSRPEKRLLRAALEWAGEAVLRDATRAGVVREALAPILTQDTPALRERAARLAARLTPLAGPRGRTAPHQAAVLRAELPSLRHAAGPLGGRHTIRRLRPGNRRRLR
jgi:hypothetical protein